ncbi:MAG: DNA polymerase I [Clostridia bacterium]|nr:DNA polymerase I [Clostridia bacterium]
MKKKLLAVDGNSILNRAFYGIRPLTTKDGFYTNALYGMVNIISKQVTALSPDYCAVAFDLKAPTFRHHLYDAYKAGRRPMPEELKMQMPVAKELMRTLGFSTLELEGYEADDILGTLARMCEEADVDAYLLTGDKDALQLIGPSVHVLLATNQDTVDMDEAAFFAKYGVPATSFVDVKALMGDSSDNIPGVAGIGEKTALKLISEYASLDGVYENLPTAPLSPSVRTKLEAGKDNAYLSQTLATICRTVPLAKMLSDVAYTGIQKKEARAMFVRLEFSAFLKKFDLTESEEAADGIENPSVHAPSTVQTVSYAVLREKLQGDAPVAFAMGEDGTLQLCVGEEILRVEERLGAITPLLKAHPVVCYDCKTLYKTKGLEHLRALRVQDVMLGAYLVNSSKSNFELSTLVSDYLGAVPSESTPSVAYLLPLYTAIWEKLQQSGQLALLEEIEIPLAAVLADMETTGFYIDRAGIACYGEQLGTLAEALEAQIYFHAGKSFNINSPKQLGEVLFDILKLPHAKKTKTGYSTNAEILEKLRPYHPIIQDILDYRQVTKLKSTYTEGLLKVADDEGRVHTTFKQTGTATGRLSSTEPNLQNIPVRTEMGRELRRFFLPKNADYVLIDADYSQIELRILAHISGDESLIDAFLGGVDVHTATAAKVFGVSAEEVTPEMRKKAKAVNFGIMYGIGAFSLSDDIGVSRAEAQEYIDQYLAGYPKVDAYLKQVISDAYDTGYVTTLFGRRRYIPELSGSNKMQQKFGERVAMNSPIQGTAADVIKLAMIRAHKALAEAGIDARLLLQVHDELLIEAHSSCAEQAFSILQDAMEGAVAYAVPLDVDIHVGQTWYDAK